MTTFIGTDHSDVAIVVPQTLTGFTNGTLANLIDNSGNIFIALGGNDRIVLGASDAVNDAILGGSGNDFIDGGGGFDVMDGGSGTDTMDVSWFTGTYIWNMTTGQTNFSSSGEFAFNFENASTGSGADNIIGTVGNNTISTNGGNDTVHAGAGNDILIGGLGNDLLFGGQGRDVFVFNTQLNAAANTDHIADFVSGEDVFHLDHAVFAGLAKGALAEGAFLVGVVALDADDRIIYNSGTGNIYFDSNGSAAGGEIRFAHVTPGTDVAFSDFFIV